LNTKRILLIDIQRIKIFCWSDTSFAEDTGK
jgi:hypothetical protein